jgi:catechol 2,3-dioxygenase-like lactoylglutathione lyase family enzyme
MAEFPELLQTVLDTTDARALAEFYRQLLGLTYRPGDEPPPAGQPDPAGSDWLVLCDATGRRVLAFQQVTKLPEASWPDSVPHPQQLHLDLTVPTMADLSRQHDRALALGARLRFDRSDDPQEPLCVYADLSGHPFCILVHAPGVSSAGSWSG